ncbi:MAG: hypothetical protein M0Z46_09165 [Actinomycetota bacterium]|jgi:hypothetical protein|nr:hypothetical protein [Actinomycetota bacterium]
MVNDRLGSRRGDHPRPRTRIERRLVVLGVATVLVLVIPGSERQWPSWQSAW